MGKLLCSLLLLLSLPCLAETQSKVDDPTYGGKVYRAWHIATFHIGINDWQTSNGHTGGDAPLDFADEASLSWGGQYLYLFDWGLGVGFSAYLYEKDIQTPSGLTPAKVLHGHALLQYHFNRGGLVKPFVGLGTGVVAMGFEDGPLAGHEPTGISYEITTGISWYFSKTVGMRAQYSYLNFKVDEEINNTTTNIDSSAQTLLVGVSFYF